MTAITSGLLGVDITATPSANDTGHALGTLVEGVDGTKWMYVHANGAITQYDFVGIDEDYEAAKLTAAMAGDGYMIGAAQVAFADNDYGWVAMTGSNIQGNLLASCAADTALYTSGTAGSLDDATTGTKVDGVVAVASPGTAAGNAEVMMTYPRSGTF